MAKTITKVLAACACSLLLASLATPPGDFVIDSAVAREGGGGGHGGGGHGGGHAGDGGHGGGIGQGAGLGAGHAKSEAAANANANGLANRNDSPGNATSAAARSKETTGLAKAMSVVSTTAASVAAALGLQNAFDKQASHDAEDAADDVGEPDTAPTP